MGRHFRVLLQFERQLKALHQIPAKQRIVQVDATGGLVRKVPKYTTILNYVMLVKNMSALDEAGLNIIEMATSRHDAQSIGNMFDLGVDNYRSLYPIE